jgi:putative acetyltransferase
MVVSIRPEQPADAAAIRRVLEAAFPTAAEARLVELLGAEVHLVISLVAESDGEIVGHIAFSPVRIDGESVEGIGIGLAPLAVVPEYQRRGIGGQLIREGLAACEHAGYGFVVVLGEPEYYQRFGFTRADRRGLGNEYGADEAFMVLELREGRIPEDGGLVRYGPEFAAFAIRRKRWAETSEQHRRRLDPHARLRLSWYVCIGGPNPRLRRSKATLCHFCQSRSDVSG